MLLIFVQYKLKIFIIINPLACKPASWGAGGSDAKRWPPARSAVNEVRSAEGSLFAGYKPACQMDTSVNPNIDQGHGKVIYFPFSRVELCLFDTVKFWFKKFWLARCLRNMQTTMCAILSISVLLITVQCAAIQAELSVNRDWTTCIDTCHRYSGKQTLHFQGFSD